METVLPVQCATAAVLALCLSIGLARAEVNDLRGVSATDASAKSVYDFTVKDIDGDDVRLSKYKGDVLLIINMASK